MIYTFLIAQPEQVLCSMKQPRTVSCFATSLHQARAAFPGLPLALLTRTPVRNIQSQRTPPQSHYGLSASKGAVTHRRPLKRLVVLSAKHHSAFPQSEEISIGLNDNK